MLNLLRTTRDLALILGMVATTAASAQQGNMQRGADERKERLAKELSLTPEQASAWKALDEQFQAKRQELKAIPDTVARKEAMRNLAREMREAREAILTPDQREKAIALRSERRSADHARGPHAERRLAWMTKELGLTEAQQAQISEIEQRHQGKQDAALRLADEVERRKALQEVRRERQAAIARVLTPDQRERLQALKEERKANKGPHKER